MNPGSSIVIVLEVPLFLLSGICDDVLLQKMTFGFTPAGGGISVGAAGLKRRGRFTVLPVSAIEVSSGLKLVSD
jgi:hypothetical protein